MGYFEHDFEIGLRDVENPNYLSNKAILAFFENIGSYHSDSINFGLNEIPKTNSSWVLLGWKVKVLKRPIYGDKLHIVTWARNTEKFSTYRDYKVYNQNNELVIIGTSKWVLVNTTTGKLRPIPEEIIKLYCPDTKTAFSPEESLLTKLTDSEHYDAVCTCTVGRSQIDLNNHMHNLYYLDMAYEALPEEVYKNNTFNFFEITYKKQIRLHDSVKCYYVFEENTHKVVIKSLDDKKTHAIIEFK